MTVFYRKSTKQITNISSQTTDFSHFGDLAEDYRLIYDFIIAEDDDFVKQNANMFIVEEGMLKLNTDLSKYL